MRSLLVRVHMTGATSATVPKWGCTQHWARDRTWMQAMAMNQGVLLVLAARSCANTAFSSLAVSRSVVNAV